MGRCYRIWTYQEGLAALDVLNRAQEYLHSVYSDSMPREEAQFHFDARALLLRRQRALLDEMELEYVYGSAAEAS